MLAAIPPSSIANSTPADWRSCTASCGTGSHPVKIRTTFQPLKTEKPKIFNPNFVVCKKKKVYRKPIFSFCRGTRYPFGSVSNSPSARGSHVSRETSLLVSAPIEKWVRGGGEVFVRFYFLTRVKFVRFFSFVFRIFTPSWVVF